jgi:hypothetical protein
MSRDLFVIVVLVDALLGYITAALASLAYSGTPS